MLTSVVSSLLFLGQQGVISTQTLASQLHNLNAAPSPAFTAAQASSYDRASTKPGDDTWFANGDWGKYLRQEGKEFVMADLQGPGAISRIWSANPKGTLRIYFDGEKEARIAVKMADWVKDLRAALADRPDFAEEFAFWADRGWNVYLPMPYANSCKVTMEPDAGDNPNMYYQVGYRTYAPSTPVQSFRKSDIQTIMPVSPDVSGKSISQLATLSPTDSKKSVTFKGGGTLSQLSVKWPTDAAGEKFHQQLRRIWVTAKFDGQETISAPLGDLMAAPFGTRMKSKDKEINDLYLTYDMSFAKEAVFTFEQRFDNANVDVQIGFLGRAKKVDPKAVYYFHADFSRDRGRTRPIRDMNWLTANGEGYLAGCHLLVQNASKAWWGEGDEKIFVDGESFPSFFGTGTEDFLNYAWSSPTRFWTAQGSQNFSTGLANFGYCNISRFMRRDPIPFKKSIQFDVELWHWAETDATFDRMAYWYGKAGSEAVRQPRPSWAELELPDMEFVIPTVKGAIEGEKLNYAKSGGEVEVQEGFAETSGLGQLWWQKVEIGNELRIEVPFKDGEYDLSIHACIAKDYGIHLLYWNGQLLGGPIDFYNPELAWKLYSLGRVKVEGGKATLMVRCVGSNEKAIPARMFALDYLILKPLE